MTAPAADNEELARLIVATTANRLGSVSPAIPSPADLPELVVEPAAVESDLVENDPEVVLRRLQHMPKELGVLLASVGVLGFILPGIAGTPALIAGGLVLWPKTFGKVEDWFEHRFPGAHRKSMQQLGRFLDDMEERYPAAEKSEHN